MLYRTHNCGELNIKYIGKKVILSGWVNNIRRIRLKTFIDLRDYFGITQLIFDNNKFNIFLKKITKESVINIKGIVFKRIKNNLSLKTGEIEIIVNECFLINKSYSLPLDLNKLEKEKEK